MNAEQRKQAIQKKGYSLQMIADAMGKSLSTISNVINGRDISTPVANKLALLVGIPTDKFFSDCQSYAQPAMVRGAAREQKVDELRQLFSEAS